MPKSPVQQFFQVVTYLLPESMILRIFFYIYRKKILRIML